MDKIIFWELTPHEKNVLLPLVVQILFSLLFAPKK